MPLTDPNMGLSHSWAFRESGWKIGMDDNLKKIGAILQLSVLSASTTAPPGTPTDGDRYIIPSGATGAWAGKTGQIAIWLDAETDWEYYVPSEGWKAWVVSALATAVYTSAAWTTEGAAAGTWEAPWRIGGWRLWDDSGVLRANHGADPGSATDGKRVYMTEDGPGPSF